MIVNISQATYRSPCGIEIALKWKEVSRSVSHATAVGDYPQYDGGDVIDLGHTIEQYPLQCYFVGENYQRESDTFYHALLERGIATLDHPRWGSLHVIPTSISQSESYVDGIGRSIVDVTFIDVGLHHAPTTMTGDKQFFRDQHRHAITALSDQIVQNAPNPSLFTRFTQSILSPLRAINTILGRGWRLAGQWQRSFGALETALNGVMHTPRQMVAILQAFLSPIKGTMRTERLQFIHHLSGMITRESNELQDKPMHHLIQSPQERTAQSNGAMIAQTMLCLVALEVAYDTNTELTTREESTALLMHIQHLEQAYFLSVQANYGTFSIHDDAMQLPLLYAIQNLFQVTKETLLEQMSYLKMKNTRILGHAMHLYEVMHLLYDIVEDDHLAHFISLNNLTDTEIFLLPEGRRIDYYV
ncbi:DNA circularization N-terminal domain-containing protein (plasmid) [Entomospira nematocerorum]|uniref:DNA circulation N-terminal domain-containing protein n=1 Tax=Entomospira nematocerorum TaxID=2719987 RepID=A0A968KYR0_9SPIO|nr:DNA circularization N-terminal domain-containing protein [Entomospira nematocera]NIZ47807.1 hypothetical protein [Entomospira nematocera]WDI34740.1 DNA circularization N-terminal domain-containing protein [Entomospira nematocera]